MASLLNIDANPKTVKGQAEGYMTGVLYLAPYIAAGRNVCPFAPAAGCWRDCLNVAGRGGMAKGNARFESNGLMLPDNAIQRARIRRTKLFHENRAEFMAQLIKEIAAFIRRAERKGLTPCVRLNGTSDIAWESIAVNPEYQALTSWPRGGLTIFDVFPELGFYDYTKDYKRVARWLAGELPANYHLTQSYSEASLKFARESMAVHKAGASLAVVARDATVKARLIAEHDGIDGDAHDLRFTDPAGAYIVLKAKGSARRDYSGFVIGGIVLN